MSIFVQENISGYTRKRLVENRVPFIEPGSQIYLPEIPVYAISIDEWKALKKNCCLVF